MTGAAVRKWEATMARDDIGAGVAICRNRVLDGVRGLDGVRRFSGGPARTVLPDFMARCFPVHDARATFHDQVLLETKA